MIFNRYLKIILSSVNISTKVNDDDDDDDDDDVDDGNDDLIRRCSWSTGLQRSGWFYRCTWKSGISRSCGRSRSNGSSRSYWSGWTSRQSRTSGISWKSRGRRWAFVRMLRDDVN